MATVSVHAMFIHINTYFVGDTAHSKGFRFAHLSGGDTENQIKISCPHTLGPSKSPPEIAIKLIMRFRINETDKNVSFIDEELNEPRKEVSLLVGAGYKSKSRGIYFQSWIPFYNLICRQTNPSRLLGKVSGAEALEKWHQIWDTRNTWPGALKFADVTELYFIHKFPCYYYFVGLSRIFYDDPWRNPEKLFFISSQRFALIQ